MACYNRFLEGTLNEADWRRGYELAVQHRDVLLQWNFLMLRGEWRLTQDEAGPVLDAIDEALKIINRMGRQHTATTTFALRRSTIGPIRRRPC